MRTHLIINLTNFHFLVKLLIIFLYASRTSTTSLHPHPTVGKVGLVWLRHLNRYRLSRNPPATATQWSKLGV